MNIKKALLVKSLKRISNIHRLPQSQQLNASHRYPRGRDQNEHKLTACWRYHGETCHLLRSQKIRSTFSTEKTLKSRLHEHKRSARNWDCDKNDIAKHCWEEDHNFNWDEKKVIDRESWLLPGRSKKPYILWRILTILTKYPTCFLKYGFLIYGSS